MEAGALKVGVFAAMDSRRRLRRLRRGSRCSIEVGGIETSGEPVLGRLDNAQPRTDSLSTLLAPGDGESSREQPWAAVVDDSDETMVCGKGARYDTEPTGTDVRDQARASLAVPMQGGLESDPVATIAALVSQAASGELQTYQEQALRTAEATAAHEA